MDLTAVSLTSSLFKGLRGEQMVPSSDWRYNIVHCKPCEAVFHPIPDLVAGHRTEQLQIK